MMTCSLAIESSRAVLKAAAGPKGSRRDPTLTTLAGIEESIYLSYWRLLRLRARDITENTARRSALIVAPHPDDETLACGGLIARKRAEGTPVSVAVVSDGSGSHTSRVLTPHHLSELRRREWMQACGYLRVPDGNAFWLGLPDRKLESVQQEISAKLTDLLILLKPDEVYIPTSIDSHPDHRATHRAALMAVTASRLQCRVFEYPVWYWSRASWIDPGTSRDVKLKQLLTRPLMTLCTSRSSYVRLGPFRSQKLTAVAAYRSQLVNITREPNWAVIEPRILARFVGQEELFVESATRNT
jgi:LmbE family N-acetylglucosaminyl deacetylase